MVGRPDAAPEPGGVGTYDATVNHHATMTQLRRTYDRVGSEELRLSLCTSHAATANPASPASSHGA